MAFLKKREDPWDIDPAKKRRAAAVREAEAAEPPEPTAEEPEAAPEAEPAPNCPWCGKEMTRGYLQSSRGGIWLRDEEPGWTTVLGDVSGIATACDGGAMAGLYAPCWQCKSCRKLVADIPKVQRRPNYVWEGGKIVFPEEEGEKE